MKTIFLAFMVLFSLNGFAQKREKVGAPATGYSAALGSIISGQNQFYKVCIVGTKQGNPYIMDFLNCADPNANDGKIEYNLRDSNLNFINGMRRGGWELSSTFVFNNIVHYLFIR